MALNKCPICGKRVLNGTCSECGFSIPDETEISSMYNYDPDDDEFGEKEEPIHEEIPEIKVREEVERNFRNPYDYKRTPNIQTVQKDNVQIQPQKQNNVNPYSNFSPIDNQQRMASKQSPFSNGPSSAADPEFIKNLVLGIVLAMVTGIFGFIYGVRFIKKYKTTNDSKYLYSGIIILVLSFLGLIF